MGRGKAWSTESIERLRVNIADGLSNTAIAYKYGWSVKSVAKVAAKIRAGKRLNRYAGRKPIVRGEGLVELLGHMDGQPNMSVRKLAARVGIHPSSVYRALKRAGRKCFKQQKSLCLKKDHMQKRKDWARKMLFSLTIGRRVGKCTPVKLPWVVWQDEKVFRQDLS